MDATGTQLLALSSDVELVFVPRKVSKSKNLKETKKKKKI